jgi:hypothetical protein
MTRSKLEEKLPKTVTTEGLNKYRDDAVDTISYLKLVQKIIDSTEESRTQLLWEEGAQMKGEP